MPSVYLQADNSPIDATLSSLATKVLALQGRRERLAAKLHTLKPLQTISENLRFRRDYGDDTPPSSATEPDIIEDPFRVPDDEILSYALDEGEGKDYRGALATQLYRMEGITTFSVQGPKRGGTKLLAVRIEVFSRRKFHLPRYLLFSSKRSKSSKFTLTGHSLPSFVPLSSLIRKHLHTSPNLAKFVKSVRRYLFLYQRRIDAATSLQKLSSTVRNPSDAEQPPSQSIDGMLWDPMVSVVCIKWSNGTNGWMRVSEEGAVRGVVVNNVMGERRRRVEGVMKKARLDDLAERLGWVSAAGDGRNRRTGRKKSGKLHDDV